MLRRADAHGAEVQSVRVGARGGDECGDGGQRAAGGREEHQRHGRDLRDGHDVGQRVVGQAAEGRRGHREGVVQHHHGATVRARAGQRLGGERAAGAGAVLDHHGLAERGGEWRGEQPRDDVGRAAWRESLDEADGAVGCPWRLCAGGEGRERRGGEHGAACRHGGGFPGCGAHRGATLRLPRAVSRGGGARSSGAMARFVVERCGRGRWGAAPDAMRSTYRRLMHRRAIARCVRRAVARSC